MNLPNMWSKEQILKLSMTKGITYSNQRRIVEKFNSYNEFIENPTNEFAEKIKPNQLFEGKSADDHLSEQLELIEKYEIDYITFWEQEFPKNLKHTEQSPVVLYYKGSLTPKTRENISIVGTRKCSVYGRLTTERFVSELVNNDITVVSGLAYGIDSVAHQAVIKNGGITYAVVASGIDSISPAYAERLANEIVDNGGAIISEYKCETKARPGYFPQRNRIISGLSVATIVIESDSKGGSLITARFAADQGREVFAVPGPISSPKSTGCNKLIHGNLASIALSGRSVLEDLGLIEEISFADKAEKIKFENQSDKLLYEVLTLEPIHIDELPEKTNLGISEILVKLLEFEFKGLVRQLPGKYYIVN